MKNFFLTLLAAALLFACNNLEYSMEKPASKANEEGTVDVSFGLSSGAVADIEENPMTRSSGWADFFGEGSPTDYDGVDFFVFNAVTGVLEKHEFFAKNQEGSPYTINMTSTAKNVYALTDWNLEVLGLDFPNEQSLLDCCFGGEISSISEHKHVPGIGRILNLSPLDVSSGVSVEMTAMCAQVRLLETCFDIPENIAPYFENARISAIGIMNTVDSIKVSDYLDSAYVNVRLCNTTEDEIKTDYVRLYDECDYPIGEYIVSAPLTDDFFYYCLPDDENEPVLSMELTLKSGSRTYYNVPLGKLKPHKSYEITRLKITGIGADSPLVPMSREDAGFTVTVRGYSDSVTKEVTF